MAMFAPVPASSPCTTRCHGDRHVDEVVLGLRGHQHVNLTAAATRIAVRRALERDGRGPVVFGADDITLSLRDPRTLPDYQGVMEGVARDLCAMDADGEDRAAGRAPAA